VDEEFTVAAPATDDPAEVGPVDVVLFTVKSYDTETATALLPPLLHDATAVVSLQNGIGNEDVLAERIGRDHVVGGVAYIFGHVVEPGVVAQVDGPRSIVFGELDGARSDRLERLRAACDRHGILLIFDEVITGFGRLGTPFAADHFGVAPDLMTVAKGLTNGAVPMGAVLVRGGIYESVVGAAEQGIEFFHGYTYSGHPLACAAGLATLDLYAREGLLTRAAELAPYWADAIHSLRGLPHVIDLRTIGLVAGIELEPRAGRVGARGFDAFVECFRQGALVRVTGDILALSPPLIVERAHIDQLVDTIGRVLRTIE
jgi:hypothetical protein